MPIRFRLLASASMLLCLSLTAARDLEAQRRCVKGKPCGNTCIAQNRTCRVGTPPSNPTPPPASRPAPAAPPASSEGQANAAAPAASGPWVASRRGTTYYRNGCSGGNQLAVQNRIYFRTEEEAQAAGYRRSSQRGC